MNNKNSSSISFTAMYTGYTWYAYRMAPKWLTTALGRFFYFALWIPEFLGKKIIGGNIKTTLLQRHKIIDHQIEEILKKHQPLQIIEIACGLSPRGHRLKQKYGASITYIEADLPGMAQRKHHILANAGELSDTHKVVALDILSEGKLSLENIINNLDPSLPTVVVTEGLVNYFDINTLNYFWQRLQHSLGRFPKAWYITDLYPALTDDPLFILRKWMQQSLALITRSNFNLMFNTHTEIEHAFTQCGFKNTQAFAPEQFYDQLDIPRSQKRTLVRVIQCEA